MGSTPRGPHLTLAVGERDHIQGVMGAPVTLVEYGDYQCPHCGRAFPIVQSLQKRMGAKLRFVFRNFPLNNAHPNAEDAAEAAESAAVEGKFWEMHDELFKNQGELEVDNILVYAKRLKLNVKRVESELESGLHRPRVKQDFESGIRSGVNGTPTFFIDGVRFDGDWESSELLEALQAAAQ
jgi:protein-disulfide isomerase